MNDEYLIPAAETVTEYDVKKSRFIGHIQQVNNRAEAMDYVHGLRIRYPDARHHCWAYRLGNPRAPTGVASADDGEPSGTAGKPILNVLQHKDIGEVIVVVVRYFGGIKLGAGGLVRAYSASAQQAMDAVTTRTKRTLVKAVIVAGYAFEQRLRHWLAQHEGQMVNVNFAAELSFEVAYRAKDTEALEMFVLSHGGKIQAAEG